MSCLKSIENKAVFTKTEMNNERNINFYQKTRCVKKVLRLKLYLPWQQSAITETSFFFIVVFKSVNPLIPAGFPLVEASLKLLFLCRVQLHPRIYFNVIQVLRFSQMNFHARKIIFLESQVWWAWRTVYLYHLVFHQKKPRKTYGDSRYKSIKIGYILNKWGWMVCLLSNRKKRVSCHWIRGINFSSTEGEQPNFYAENTPFSCNSFLAAICPSLSLVLRLFDLFQTPVSRAFRQDSKSSYQNATSGSIVQCCNLHACQRVGSCDIKHDSHSGGCEFDLPNRPFLCPWSHFTRQTYSCTLWAAACVISFAIFFHHTTCESTCDTLSSSAANQGDNTVTRWYLDVYFD